MNKMIELMIIENSSHKGTDEGGIHWVTDRQEANKWWWCRIREEERRVSQFRYDLSFSKYSAQTLSNLLSEVLYPPYGTTHRAPETAVLKLSHPRVTASEPSLVPAQQADVGSSPC